MKQWHFYNSRLAKVPWFIRRFGLRQMLIGPFRQIFAARIIPRLPTGTFSFDGERLPYFYHTYNVTWVNERAVEIPIAMKYLAAAHGRRVLEIGNVLSHYHPVHHVILDKYEIGPDILNFDIVDYRPSALYDLILSISTFEHIGFDDDTGTSSGAKISAAIQHTRSLLAGDGMLVLTVPIGYNPDLDQLLRDDQLGSRRELYLRRTAFREWAESTKDSALQCQFKSPFPYANAIGVLEFASGNAVSDN